MPRTKIDRRIVKTKRAINVALLQLLDTKEPEEITITELTTCADINRKTFYLHYTCIKDVAAELQRNLRLATLDIIDSSRNADGTFSPAVGFWLSRLRISRNWLCFFLFSGVSVWTAGVTGFSFVFMRPFSPLS